MTITRFPNHYNILISVPEPVTGRDLALRPEAEVRFVPVDVTAVVEPRAHGAAAMAVLMPWPTNDLKETR